MPSLNNSSLKPNESSKPLKGEPCLFSLLPKQIKGLFYLAAFHHRNCCCLHFCRSSLSLTLLRVPSYFLLTGGGSPGVTVVVMMMSLLLIPASFTFPLFKPAPIFRTYQGLFSGLKRCIKSSPEVDQVLFRDSVQTCLLSYKSSRL